MLDKYSSKISDLSPPINAPPWKKIKIPLGLTKSGMWMSNLFLDFSPYSTFSKKME